MTWTEIEKIISETVINIRFVQFGRLGYSEGVKAAIKNVKALCDYMFADGKVDIDKDICRIYNYAKELRTNTIRYIHSNDDIKRVLYEDKKAELDKEPVSLKELAEELVRIETDAKIIADTISEYFMRRGKPLEPQQQPIEAPQQAIGGNGGELADSGNGTPPEGNEKPVIKKDNLPTIYNDGNKDREQQVFYNAIQNKLMVLNDDGKGYTWKTNNKLLCLMCAILYWNDEIEKSEVRIDAYNTQFVYTLKKNNIYFEDATRLKEMFGGKDISNYRSKLKELPEDWDRIDKLF